MEPHLEQARRVVELLVKGKVNEALGMDITCQYCSRNFKLAQGANEQGRQLFVICPHCQREVFSLEAKAKK